MPNLYALLVAIDAYAPPVPKLRGCLNDIAAAEVLLSSFGSRGHFELHAKTLRNDEATREAIIRGLREHLAAAGPDDFALFYFCGHGSQEDAPEEFWPLEPDRLNETLVCFDSRLEGGWDFADKELAALMSEIAEGGAHLICVLDCCHSGSGTRRSDQAIGVRRAAARQGVRPFPTYLSSERMNRESTKDSTSSGWKMLPEGRHVLLAACRAEETAKEILEGDQPRGAFSSALLSTLNLYGPNISCQDLLKRAETLVRSKVADQVPQIEANSGQDVWRGFLGPVAAARLPYATARFDVHLGWIVEAGGLHGIERAPRGEQTTFAAFRLDAPYGREHLSNASAVLKVTAVRPELSLVQITPPEARLDEHSTYRAVLVSVPLRPLKIGIEGLGELASLLRRDMQTADVAAFVCTAEGNADEGIEYSVDCETDTYSIKRGSEIVFSAPYSGQNAPVLLRGISRQLEHIARWEEVRRLGNPASRLISGDVRLSILRRNGLHGDDYEPLDTSTGQATLIWDEADPDQIGADLRAVIRNVSQEPLYCGVLWLRDDFSISSDLSVTAERIPPGREFAVLGGRPFRLPAPELSPRGGRRCTTNTLKLLVSTEPFDPKLFAQESLEAYASNDSAGPPAPLANVGDRLAKRGQVRTAGVQFQEERPDWMGKNTEIRLEATR